MVERNLAKVEVAGSNPVSRSKFKARWQSGDANDCNSLYSGSIPLRASILKKTSVIAGFFLPLDWLFGRLHFDDWYAL